MFTKCLQVGPVRHGKLVVPNRKLWLLRGPAAGARDNRRLSKFRTFESMQPEKKGGSRKNIWNGLGRLRIEIPKPVLKERILDNKWLRQLYVCGLGYYPQATGHYTYRKKGLPENFLFYCVDGHGWYKIGKNQYKVQPNEFFILPQNIEHAYGSDEKDPWTVYWIHFGGEALPPFNELTVISDHFKPVYAKNNAEIVALFTRIYKTLELGYSIDNLLFANMCLSHFVTLFIYQSRHYSVDTSEQTDCVENAIRFMQEHINENISLNDLSRKYNYSASRFSSLFRQKTGYAPIDYFIQMKMQKASQHLDFTDRSIKDIALSMGFDDPYYFSKRFRKVIGMSPTQYRSVYKDQK